MVKRSFDIVLSLTALSVAWLPMAIIAATIKLTSPGPVLYCGSRVGRFGKDFRIFKFRSMVVDAEALGGSSTSNGDCRITPVGRFLRKYKLDELPQLFNVLFGQMSFVGPRPEVREYVDLYSAEEQAILNLRPGITDWASIWNSDEGSILAAFADPDQAYLDVIRPTKLKLQLLYGRNAGVWEDVKVIVSTARRLVDDSWQPTTVLKHSEPLPAIQARHLERLAAAEQPKAAA
ncbi:sugar transferase [Roseimaritima sediminicola]|uniref:sugar transferase n=1 Tax=Roseimaritima sediminicola TaxID=2662066 RepID=UPI0012984BDA|nr:sugar transferase [Roseimaritima sediminicola]